MRWLRLLLVVLLALLALAAVPAVVGRGRPAPVAALRAAGRSSRRARTRGLQQRNDALAAEVEDLKSGEAAVEERARSELGMIKPGETFYRVVEPASPTAAPAAEPTPATRTPTKPTRCRRDLGRGARRRTRHALRRRRAQAVPRGRRPSR